MVFSCPFSVQVKMLTNHLSCGTSVTVDIEEDMPAREIKKLLEQKTGVPMEFQKLIMGGVAEMYMGDTRTNIKYVQREICAITE